MRDLAHADRRAWCTIESADVRSLLRDEHVVLAHGPTCRNATNLVRNLAVAWRLVLEQRPRVILCTGSGIVVPFAWVGRLLGAHVIYVECGGRVDAPSMSCRMVNRIAHRSYVQWPELARHGRFHGRLPWERSTDRRRTGATAGGTLVTVGTSRKYAFDRLVRASALLGASGPVVVQRGASVVRPSGAQVVDFMSFDEIRDAVADADAVVTHAGIGSVLLALTHGHRPIVVPRQAGLGEGVDDHQVRFARRLEAEGLATVVIDPAELPAALRALPARAEAAAPDTVERANALLARLEDDMREALAG